MTNGNAAATAGDNTAPDTSAVPSGDAEIPSPSFGTAAISNGSTGSFGRVADPSAHDPALGDAMVLSDDLGSVPGGDPNSSLQSLPGNSASAAIKEEEQGVPDSQEEEREEDEGGEEGSDAESCYSEEGEEVTIELLQKRCKWQKKLLTRYLKSL